MPLFSYTAISNDGRRSDGTREASSTSELAKELREEGFILISAKSQEKPEVAGSVLRKIIDAFRLFGRIPLVEKMMFARHLSVMIKAGFSLNKALQVLVLQTKNRRFSKIISALEESVRKGNNFGDSLAKYPDVFSSLFVNMVKVGEASGSLEEDLSLLAIQMKKDHDLRSKIKSAMLYPSVILVAMFCIGAGMMIFVVPKLLDIFEELNVELPLATRIVIGVSNFLSAQWLLSGLLLVSLIVSLRLVLKTKKGKETLDGLILKAPVFGVISKKINSARMARTVSSLVESGVPIVRTLEITAGTLSNTFFNQSLIQASREVQKGQSISQILASFKNLYPPLVTQMIQVGEETGTLGEITKRLAEFYEEEVANVTKGLSSIIEPILMIIIGAAVGFFAISMIQPMYSMMNEV